MYFPQFKLSKLAAGIGSVLWLMAYAPDSAALATTWPESVDSMMARMHREWPLGVHVAVDIPGQLNGTGRVFKHDRSWGGDRLTVEFDQLTEWNDWKRWCHPVPLQYVRKLAPPWMAATSAKLDDTEWTPEDDARAEADMQTQDLAATWDRHTHHGTSSGGPLSSNLPTRLVVLDEAHHPASAALHVPNAADMAAFRASVPEGVEGDDGAWVMPAVDAHVALGTELVIDYGTDDAKWNPSTPTEIVGNCAAMLQAMEDTCASCGAGPGIPHVPQCVEVVGCLSSEMPKRYPEAGVFGQPAFSELAPAKPKRIRVRSKPLTVDDIVAGGVYVPKRGNDKTPNIVVSGMTKDRFIISWRKSNESADARHTATSMYEFLKLVSRRV